MKRSRITFYLYLTGNITTFLGVIIMSIFGEFYYLIIGIYFLSHILGTVRAYKEKHKLIRSHGQNPNVAGWFNGFSIALFLGVMYVGISGGTNQVPQVLMLTLWLVAFFSYIIGAIIYKKTPINEITSHTEISEDSRELMESQEELEEKIHEKETILRDLEIQYSAGVITEQDNKELNHQKKTIIKEINALRKFDEMTDKLLRMELNSKTEPRRELILVEGNESKINKNDLTKYTIYNDTTRAKINLYCMGKGTNDDPIIIKPYKGFPESFSMSFSKEHILIADFDSDTQKIYMAACENVTIRNCKLKWLYLRKCSNINLEDIKFKYNLFLRGCDNLFIEDCEIPLLKFRYCSENKFKNCWINQFERIFDCRGNIFIGNNIPEKEMNKLYRNSYIRRSTGIIIFVFVILFTIIPIILSFDVLFFLLFLGVFVIGWIFFARIDIKSSKKYREKYPPNKII